MQPRSGILRRASNDLDFKIETGKPVHPDSGPVRIGLSGKRLVFSRHDGIELRSAVSVKPRNIYDAVEGAACGLQDIVEVLKRKLNLFLESLAQGSHPRKARRECGRTDAPRQSRSLRDELERRAALPRDIFAPSRLCENITAGPRSVAPECRAPLFFRQANADRSFGPVSLRRSRETAARRAGPCALSWRAAWPAASSPPCSVAAGCRAA
jgi:hypothetical protein